MDDFITSILNPFHNGAGTLQDYLPADSDIAIPEDQLQLLSFINDLGFSDFAFSDFAATEFAGSESASDTQNSEVVQVDHNYSLHWDWSLLQSIASELADMAEKDMSTDVSK